MQSLKTEPILLNPYNNYTSSCIHLIAKYNEQK